MREAHIFVLPSIPDPDGDIDGIPVSLMEAMASGCPVISTEVSGIPELVVDGVTGLLVAPNEPAELALAIRRLAADADLRVKLIQNGRCTIEDEFDAARSAAMLRDFFHSRRNVHINLAGMN
ncbi:MAG: glycosyltransferase [bacterium]|nr:glycosyltransferase [bacterium]